MLKTTRCVIIDDEPKAVSVLAAQISKIEGLDIVGKFTDTGDALHNVPDLAPDIVFIDVEMTRKNGFEVVDELRILGLTPKIVFTTGYDQYAMKAIKKQAFDYLLKPIIHTDIIDLMARMHVEKTGAKTLTSVNQNKIRFNTLNGFYIMEIGEILYVKADGNYSEVHLRDNSFKLITSNLAKIESQLEGNMFKRIGRSLIINTRFVTQVDTRRKKCYLQSNQGIIDLPIVKKRIRELADMFE